jgi:hypothetical protein
VFLDEAMRLEIGVYGDDDFLQQSEFFYICLDIRADTRYDSNLTHLSAIKGRQ